jgi:hypothetical protein
MEKRRVIMEKCERCEKIKSLPLNLPSNPPIGDAETWKQWESIERRGSFSEAEELFDDANPIEAGYWFELVCVAAFAAAVIFIALAQKAYGE